MRRDRYRTSNSPTDEDTSLAIELIRVDGQYPRSANVLPGCPQDTILGFLRYIYIYIALNSFMH